jgi:hypothetical protein
MKRVEGTKWRYGCGERDWKGPISQVVLVAKFDQTIPLMESLPRFACVYTVFVDVRIVL